MSNVLDTYAPEEQLMIARAQAYVDVSPEPRGGFPGHYMILLVAKLATDLAAATGGLPVQEQARRFVQEAQVQQSQGRAPAHTQSYNNARAANGDEPATESQVKKIFGVAYGQLHMSKDDLLAEIDERYECEPSQLSKREASAFIDSLEKRAGRK